MSEREEREEREVWSPEHRKAVVSFEQKLGVGAMAFGAVLMAFALWRDMQWGGWAGGFVLGVGFYGAVPDVRPFLSEILRRVPVLKKNGNGTPPNDSEAL